MSISRLNAEKLERLLCESSLTLLGLPRDLRFYLRKYKRLYSSIYWKLQQKFKIHEFQGIKKARQEGELSRNEVLI